MIPETHYAWPDEPGKRTVKTLCGRYVKRSAVVIDPNCPICAARLLRIQRIAESECEDGDGA